MHLHEFVFSEKPVYRFLRHAVFWIAWWLYFSLCYYIYQQPVFSKLRYSYVTVGSHVLIKTFLLVLIYLVACHSFIYFLLPQIIKGSWLKVVANIMLVCAFLFGAGYFLYWNLFPFVDSLFGPYKPNSFVTRFWPAVNLGLLNPLKVFAAAAIIKYVKYWWLKKKESEKLEREKVNAELQLLKAQIHPNFLFTSLNNIYTYSLAASPRAPEMLLKLSDLLSYMLYECDQTVVRLEKEIEMMKVYIALEKKRLNDAIDIELNISGEMTGKMIAPLLFLPFIENSFKQSSERTEQAWINMDISIDDYCLVMKLANGIVPEITGDENGFANVQKRLNLIYPKEHELKISCEPEMQIVLLKIWFAETTAEELIEDRNVLFIETATPQPNLYA